MLITGMLREAGPDTREKNRRALCREKEWIFMIYESYVTDFCHIVT